jgi:hypothetical protein
MSVSEYKLTDNDMEETIGVLQRLLRARKVSHADVLEKRIATLQSQLNTKRNRITGAAVSAKPR